MPDSLLFYVVLVCLWLVVRGRLLAKQKATDARLSQLETHVASLERKLADLASDPSSSEPARPPIPPPPLARLDSVARPEIPPPLVASSDGTLFTPTPPDPSPTPQPATPAIPPPLPDKTPASAPGFDWEQFVGVKLFAWVGGLAVLFCIAYFLKYSFEHAWLPPSLRAATGFLIGIGLIVGGVCMNRKRYQVTAHTLCATGVVVLYAATFGCRSVYHFEAFTPKLSFLLMSLITAAGFVLAVRLRAQVVAVLGMLGGFLTPLLVGEGQNDPLALFGYLTILDIGLVAVALVAAWPILIPLGALGTLLLQAGWAVQFFSATDPWTAIGIGLTFDLLFVVAFALARRRALNSRAFAAASGLVSVCSLLASLVWALDSRLTGHLFLLVVGADLCLLALVWLDSKLERLQLLAGGLTFLVASTWMVCHPSPEMLPWALGMSLFFGVLHSAVPLVLKRRSPREYTMSWGHLFPPLALLLMLVPVTNQPLVSLLLWPFVFLVDLLAMALAILTGSLLSFGAALLVTLILLLVAVTKIPVGLASLPSTLVLIGSFAVIFTSAAVFLLHRLAKHSHHTPETPPSGDDKEWLPQLPPEIASCLPALSAIMPFFLLVLLVGQLQIAEPSAVFSLALLLAGLVLVLARFLRFDWLPAVGLAGVLMVEHAWFMRSFGVGTSPELLLAWAVGFSALFGLFPFCERQLQTRSTVPWAAAALAAPLHFGLIYKAVSRAWPNSFMGLLPLILALPCLLGIWVLTKRLPKLDPARVKILAWFGGAALFFITLIFPIQFERQWLTLSWALEGAALLWLFHRLPHPGLQLVGTSLLCLCFGRLSVNAAVLDYYPRSTQPILNWYLYTYGVVTACLFVGARLLAPPRNRVLGRDVHSLLNTLGVVLAFLLVNIEIADFFTPPGTRTLTFDLSGNLARDMTYSISWALFSLGLLLVGITRRLPGARYASMGLLSVTLLKLFLHDLARLSGLYRIGAIFIVAIIAIVASFLFQRFLGTQNQPPKSDNNRTP